MTLRTVIFDFDGTLHDSMRIYPAALREGLAWLAGQGFDVPTELPDEQAASYIGMTADAMWESFAPGLPADVRAQVSRIVGRSMERLMTDGTGRLFAGVPEMLDGVRNLGVALVFLSNCQTSYQQAARKVFGLDRWFSGYFNSQEWHDAPKEEVFRREIAPRFGGGWAMVGDRASDLAVAREPDVVGIGCSYGYGSGDELAAADLVASSPADVLRCLGAIARGGTE